MKKRTPLDTKASKLADYFSEQESDTIYQELYRYIKISWRKDKETLKNDLHYMRDQGMIGKHE